jgi:hypothetical protein
MVHLVAQESAAAVAKHGIKVVQESRPQSGARQKIAQAIHGSIPCKKAIRVFAESVGFPGCYQ